MTFAQKLLQHVETDMRMSATYQPSMILALLPGPQATEDVASHIAADADLPDVDKVRKMIPGMVGKVLRNRGIVVRRKDGTWSLAGKVDAATVRKVRKVCREKIAAYLRRQSDR